MSSLCSSAAVSNRAPKSAVAVEPDPFAWIGCSGTLLGNEDGLKKLNGPPFFPWGLDGDTFSAQAKDTWIKANEHKDKERSHHITQSHLNLANCTPETYNSQRK
jgi:hypothetical protein